MIINKKELETSEKRKEILDLVEKVIESVQPKNLFKQIKLKNKVLYIGNKKHKIEGRIFVIGGGKAAGEMAVALENAIGIKNITAGIVNCTKKTKTKKIKIIKARHPIPNKAGVKGVAKILQLKHKYNINEKDTIICLISGGGSALLPYPTVSLKEFQKINENLITSGANIEEINIVRKHISKIKGGQLAKFFEPAQIISLIISDVVGDDISTIASGPTIGDKSTIKDAQKIINKYGINTHLVETPKKVNASNYILANNNTALNSIRGTKIRNIQGDTEKTALKIYNKFRKSKSKIMICGGETTLKIPKVHGKGGRNMHYALTTLNKKVNFTMASFGTDGQDFIGGTAGAIIDSKTEKFQLKESLKNFNSYNFFKYNKSLIKTGYTGTNVGDIIIYIK